MDQNLNSVQNYGHKPSPPMKLFLCVSFHFTPSLNARYSRVISSEVGQVLANVPYITFNPVQLNTCFSHLISCSTCLQ